MKSILSTLAAGILLCAIFCNCTGHTIYCGKLKERLFFVPQNAEIGDTLTLHSNKGDMLTYTVSNKVPVADDQFKSACECVCEDYFGLTFNESQTHLTLNYKFDYGGYRERGLESMPVNVQLSVNSHNYSFHYSANENGVLNSVSVNLLDSLMINNICYYDVMALQDSLQTVHVAKDIGIVQITEQNGVYWTLNDWNTGTVKATNSITLKPGFQTIPGKTFEARISPSLMCNP